MICHLCKKRIKRGEKWMKSFLNRKSIHIDCPSEAKRSGVLQGCLPSTNCSAEARAEAHSDSLINSVVPPKKAIRSGVALIAEERQRQVSKEGWTPEHDDKHKGKQMARAAGSYLGNYTDPDDWAAQQGELPGPFHDWPWARKWWKPSSDPIRNLVKAGALIAAEIDRLQRKQARAALALQGERAIRRNDGTQRPGSPDGSLATESRKPGSLK